MKRVLLTAVIFPLAALTGLNCSSDDPIQTGPKAGAGGAGATGGGAGSGGTSAGGSGGGTGGATGGTAGDGMTGGAGGATGGAGGATGGAGGATGGAGGATGGAGGAGGATGGAGGSAGTGAVPDAGGTGGARPDASAGGSGGQGRPDGGPAAMPEASTPGGNLCANGDCRSVVGTMDGYLTPSLCTNVGAGYDCGLVDCGATNTKTFASTFTLTGPAADATKNFDIRFAVRGIVECKTVQGGMRDSMDQGQTQLAGGNDMFHIGGTLPASNYNTHELHVMPRNPAPAASDWYLNSCPTGFGEAHYTWVLNYTKTIRVAGGSTISYRGYDANCRQITNCGAGEAQQGCPNSWPIPTAALAALTPPVTVTAATINSSMFRGQYLALDVLSVTAAP